jgi:hypothetical protein
MITNMDPHYTYNSILNSTFYENCLMMIHQDGNMLQMYIINELSCYIVIHNRMQAVRILHLNL